MRVVKGLLIVVLNMAAPSFGETLNNIDVERLTVTEAEAIALERDPLIEGFTASARAYREQAVAAQRLPDPRLTLGIVDLPVDSFDFKEPETQKMIGLQQSFPPWGSLTSRGAEVAAMAASEDAALAERRQKVRQSVRLAWLDLYYQIQANEQVKHSQRTFNDVLKVTQSRYRSGSGKQQDVVLAELELGRLEDRLIASYAQQDVVLAELARWMGEAIASPSRIQFPELPPLPRREDMLTRAQHHPAVVMQEALVASKREGVAVARAMYKPEVMIDVSYGQREGSLNDMVTGLVTVQLPIFRAQRQDRQLASAQQQVIVSQGEANEVRRDLRAQVDAEYVRWQRSSERLKFYQQKLLPLAARNSETSLTGYRSNVTDLSDHVIARLDELDSNLEALALQVERGKAHVNILYLISEE